MCTCTTGESLCLYENSHGARHTSQAESGPIRPFKPVVSTRCHAGRAVGHAKSRSSHALHDTGTRCHLEGAAALDNRLESMPAHTDSIREVRNAAVHASDPATAEQRDSIEARVHPR